MDMPKTFTIEQSYYLESSFEKVFRALTDSNMLVKWFLSKAKVELKKGGSYSFDWIGGYHMTGEVKQFEANKAVTFS